MTIRALYQGYTVTQAREFKERREQFRLQLIREAVEEGLVDAEGFDIKTLI